MNSRERIKKDNERRTFDDLTRLSPELNLTFLDQPKEPAPDILANSNDVRIGIEITRHLRDLEKQRESEEEKIIQMARDQYVTKGGPCIDVAVYWIPHNKRLPAEPGILSAQLVSVVSGEIPQLGTWTTLDCTKLPDPLRKAVDSVRIANSGGLISNHWHSPRFDFVPTVLPDAIRPKIADKEAHLREYKSYCDKVWLLIASEGLGPSSAWEFHENDRQVCYTTRFDRVFFLARHPDEVIELCIRKP